MLDSNLKQAYEKITPSPDLKHKILSMHVEPQKRQRAVVLPVKSIATVAACLVLLLGGVMLTSRLQRLGQSDILLQGEVALSEQELLFVPQTVENTADAAMPRVASIVPATHNEEVDNVAIDLYVDPRGKTEISVEQGSLCIGTELQGEGTLEPAGQHISVEKENGMTLIRWVIPIAGEDAEYRMTVGEEVIRVIYRASSNEYFISRSDAES